MNLKIPTYAKREARKALEERRKLPESRKFGLDKKEAEKLGINSGVERAKQLIRSDSLPIEDVKAVARFYQRFRNCRTKNCEYSIKLWGGRRFGRLCVDFVKKAKI